MTLAEIQQEINCLSEEEQSILCHNIFKSLGSRYTFNPCKEKGERYILIMNSLVGRDIRSKEQDSGLVWARFLVINQLIQEGYTETQVGQLIGKTHSTVYYIKNRVKEAFEVPMAYQTEMKLWKEFQNAIS